MVLGELKVLGPDQNENDTSSSLRKGQAILACNYITCRARQTNESWLAVAPTRLQRRTRIHNDVSSLRLLEPGSFLRQEMSSLRHLKEGAFP